MPGGRVYHPEMPNTFVVDGAIGARWRAWSAGVGPFGAAIGAAEAIAGGRRQRFEWGEITESPAQALVVSVFRIRNMAWLHWTTTRGDIEFNRYDIRYDGVTQDQSQAEVRGTDHIVTRLQGGGEWEFVVGLQPEDDDFLGWSIPVRLRVDDRHETPRPDGLPVVDGLIAQRWHELGGWDGPLGRPTATAAAGADGTLSQRFEYGVVVVAPAFGSEMTLAVYVLARDVVLEWGPGDEEWDLFSITDDFGGTRVLEDGYSIGVVFNTEWGRPHVSSGRYLYAPPGGLPDGVHRFQVSPGKSFEIGFLSNPGTGVPDPVFFADHLPPVELDVRLGSRDVRLVAESSEGSPLDPRPSDGSPQLARASHAVRVNAVARQYAASEPLEVWPFDATADENATMRLVAHLHAISHNPGFAVPGQPPSRRLVPAVLRQFLQGQVGTHIDAHLVLPERKGDYDMALKGLMVIAYRYRGLLSDDDFEVLLRLVPRDLRGGHSEFIEEVHYAGLTFPETENHLLMIESVRYLTNQLLLDRTGDPAFDNVGKGMTGWLLGYLQRLLQHDFLEFNARPYQRLAVHPLINLHEFARDTEIRDAAQMVLDYLSVKFAISSVRGLRVSPFRRLRERTYKDFDDTESHLNDLRGDLGDPWVGFWLMYGGPVDADGRPEAWFRRGWSLLALIAGLAPYRPPWAAYTLAMEPPPPTPPSQHTFNHGRRPRLAASMDTPEGGMEIYYRSRSFLISAGGMWLNSGYGLDQAQGFAQVAVAQATTLIPTRAPLDFRDLIKFTTPYPDWRRAVQMGVHRGFACGANLMIPFPLLDKLGLGSDVISPRAPTQMYFLDLNRDADGLRMGFHVFAYRVRIGPRYGDVGPPSNAGFLYAVEATEMDFERFRELTVANNPHLPKPLGWTTVEHFTGPDGHRFDFVLWPDNKRANRVVRYDDAPVPDLAAGPLVDGPWLRAARKPDGTGGHEGRIEIRHPGCGVPLVLDFTDAAHPRRDDNTAACPEPVHTLALGALAYADHLRDVSRTLATDFHLAEAAIVARDHVDVFDDIDPPPDLHLRYLRAHAEALHTAIQRLLVVDDVDAGVLLLTRSVDAYRALAATDRAGVLDVCDALLTLSINMATPLRLAEAVLPAAAAVDVVAAFQPTADETARFAETRARATFTLALRLKFAGRPDEALPVARQAVELYRPLAGVSSELADTLDTAERLLASLEPPILH